MRIELVPSHAASRPSSPFPQTQTVKYGKTSQNLSLELNCGCWSSSPCSSSYLVWSLDFTEEETEARSGEATPLTGAKPESGFRFAGRDMPTQPCPWYLASIPHHPSVPRMPLLRVTLHGTPLAYSQAFPVTIPGGRLCLG